MALGSAGSPNGSQPIILSDSQLRRITNRQNTETYEGSIKILMWTATIVAIVTIVIGFTCTNIYINSAPESGIRGLVKTAIFTVFMLCNCVPFLDSFEILIDIIIRKRHLSNVVFIQKANERAWILVLIACMSMFVAFMVGVCLVFILFLWQYFFHA